MIRPTANTSQSFRQAIGLFQSLVDPKMLHDLQPMGPATVYTPWVTTFLLVYQRLNANATLNTAVAHLLNIIGTISDNKRVRDKTLSANTAAYSQARKRLKVEVAQAVADHVCQSIIKSRLTSWLGQRCFILDGTTLSLSSCDKLRDAFPAGANQHGPGTWPIAHLVLAHELESGAALRAEIGTMYGPKPDSELGLAIKLLARIPANSMLMADRNFGVFAFAYAAVRAGHNLLTRLTEPRFRSMVKSAEAVSPGLWKLKWTPSRAERKSHPGLPKEAEVEVWLHEFVGFSGERMWVVTTSNATTHALADLYAKRPRIETDIRQLKHTLECEALRGKSQEMIEKELAMAMVSFNLVVQVRTLAAERLEVEPRQLSFTGVWSLVTKMLLSPNNWTAEEWEANFEWVLRGAGQRKLPKRKRRSYPRKVLPRRRKFPEHNPRKPEEPVK